MAIFKHKLAGKLPTRDQVFPVFSLILFVVFTWALYRMAWQLQSWLYIMNLAQVLILAAYVLAFALVESLVVLGFVLALELALPSRLFRDQFVVQGSLLVGLLSAGAILLQHHLDLLDNLTLTELALYPLLFLAVLIIFLVIFSVILARIRWIARLVNAVADRLTVFSFIYIPLSLIGLAVVIARNLL